MPRLTLRDFSGGLWIPDQSDTLLEQAGFAVPPNGLLRAENLDFLPSGAVRGRRGSTIYNPDPLPAAVLVLRRFYARPISDGTLGRVTAANDASVGSIDWQNVSGAELADNSRARVGLQNTEISRYLVGFGPFAAASIPTGATITGIRVTILYNAFPALSIHEKNVRLFKAGVPVGTDKSTGASFPGTLTTAVYGGAGDLWGVALSADEVSAQDFGVGISVENTSGSPGIGFVEWISVRIFFTDSSANQFIAAYSSGSNLQYVSGTAGVWSNITGGTLASPSRRPHIVSWPQKGKLFLFDGVNALSQYDGDKISPVLDHVDSNDPTAVFLSPRKGPYAALHKGRLWATEPGELAFSVYGSEVNDETDWRPDVQLSVNDDRGGSITGVESFGDNLVIFKDTAVFRFPGDRGPLVKISDHGCVAPDSVAVTPYGVIYVGREGVWLTDGDTVVLLSAPLRPLFVERTTETLYADAVGVYFPRRDQFWLQLTPGTGDGFVLHHIVIPTNQGEQQQLAWSRIPGLPMNCGTVFEGAGDIGELYLGDTGGTVWLRDTGSTDNAVAYTSELMTRQQLLDDSRVEGRVNRVRAIYRALGTMPTFLRYDQTVTDDVILSLGAAGGSPTIQEPRAYVADQAKFGRWVSIRSTSLEASQFELHRFDLDVRLRGQRLWR